MSDHSHVGQRGRAAWQETWLDGVHMLVGRYCRHMPLDATTLEGLATTIAISLPSLSLLCFAPSPPYLPSIQVNYSPAPFFGCCKLSAFDPLLATSLIVAGSASSFLLVVAKDRTGSRRGADDGRTEVDAMRGYEEAVLVVRRRAEVASGAARNAEREQGRYRRIRLLSADASIC